jgi:hypothetical protein
MKTQQIFLSSRSRDAGTPNDMFITFRNGLIKESSTSAVPPRVSIELVEFAITRLWYDIQTGINDTFQVSRVADQTTFTITIPQGWYTIGGVDTVATGVAIEPVLAALLTATVGGVWGIVVNPLLGTFQFQTPAAGGSGYSFNFTSASRCNDFLGFNKLVYLAVNDVIVGAKPFHLTRTLQIVMHTDIQPAFPQCTLDNYGQSLTPFDNSDILAVIPVDQPPRGRINYQTTDKINRVWIKPEELRTVRIFFTDDREVPLDFSFSEWTAVLRVVYGDNLSV